MKNISYRKILYWAGVIASPLILTVLIILTLFPFRLDERILFKLPYFDKIAHFISYAAFSCCLFLSVAFVKLGDTFKTILSNNNLKAIMVVLLSSLIGLIIEIIQPSFGRSFDLLDALANSLGSIFGLFISSLLLLYGSALDKRGQNL